MDSYPPLDPQVVSNWQSVVETLARVAQVPSAILTHADGPYIEVIRSAEIEGNPYKAGMRVLPNGHYCETVIRENRRLHVKHAPTDPDWMNAPEIKYGMVSYLGLPLLWPDNSVFGTICVLDRKSNEYSSMVEDVLLHFKRLVESHLAILVREAEVDALGKELEKKLHEISVLKSLIPICASCKKVRNDDGYWQSVEEYLRVHADIHFTHGLCPTCSAELFPRA